MSGAHEEKIVKEVSVPFNGAIRMQGIIAEFRARREQMFQSPSTGQLGCKEFDGEAKFDEQDVSVPFNGAIRMQAKMSMS